MSTLLTTGHVAHSKHRPCAKVIVLFPKRKNVDIVYQHWSVRHGQIDRVSHFSYQIDRAHQSGTRR